MTTPDALVTDAELAALADVSPRRIRQLAESGILERVGRNQFVLGPSIRALLEEASGSGSALVRERTRKVKADADRAELELALARKEVAPIHQMARMWERQCSLIRAGMLNIPQRAVVRILGETNERTVKAVLREEITAALQAAADSVDQPDETEDEEDADDE